MQAANAGSSDGEYAKRNVFSQQIIKRKKAKEKQKKNKRKTKEKQKTAGNSGFLAVHFYADFI